VGGADQSPETPTASTSGALSRDEEVAWRALARAFLVVPRVLESELQSRHGLTLTEYSVLSNLADGSLRMTELAEKGAMSLSAISRVADRLAGAGLIERARCPEDARACLVELTEAGAQRLRAAHPTHVRGVRQHVLCHLAGMDLGVLAEAVSRFASTGAGKARLAGLSSESGV
jgi:DNA-binding MarR family transcriptional regulator